MIDSNTYIKDFDTLLPAYNHSPWEIPANIETLIRDKIGSLPSDYIVRGGVAIHKDAVIEEHVIMKGVMIIGPKCFIGAHAYLRGGIWLEERVVVGPGCEVKSSIIMSGSALAHFNFVGDSVVGHGVNMEAGSVIANHYNERPDKAIDIVVDDLKQRLPVIKFGALVGDNTRIGANAVLSPGTILKPGSVVRRLELIEQVK